MKKFIILILIIFAVSYAQNIYEYEVKEHYYQILLKEWQKSGSYQEFDPRSITSEMRKSCETRDIAQEELNKYYKELKTLSIRIASIGKYFEYELVCVRGLPKKEQLWMLISVPLKKVVATHKDKIKPDIPAKNPHHWLEEWDARVLYVYLLTKWKESRHFEEYSPLSWEWWKNTDSVTAVSQAIKAAREHYGQEMAALPPRLMGNSNEFWLVYCFPSILFEKRMNSCYDHIVWRYENWRLSRPSNIITVEPDCYKETNKLMSKVDEFEKGMAICYNSIMLRYKYGGLYMAMLNYNPDRLPDCFQLIVVLISRANGQVIYMEEIKNLY